jgi:hypothetical protein
MRFAFAAESLNRPPGSLALGPAFSSQAMFCALRFADALRERPKRSARTREGPRCKRFMGARDRPVKEAPGRTAIRGAGRAGRSTLAAFARLSSTRCVKSTGNAAHRDGCQGPGKKRPLCCAGEFLRRFKAAPVLLCPASYLILSGGYGFRLYVTVAPCAESTVRCKF